MEEYMKKSDVDELLIKANNEINAAIIQTKHDCSQDLFKLIAYDARPQWRYKAKIRKYLARLVDKWDTD